MKNRVLKVSLLYLFIGLIVSSCSTSQKITSCPNFKSKNKKVAFTLKAKKKHKKVASKIVRTNSKKNDTSVSKRTAYPTTVNQINSISYTTIKNLENTAFSSALPKALPTPIIANNSNKEIDFNEATVSTENFMEIMPVERLKSLGIDHIVGSEKAVKLSKKEIKAIKKQAKKDLKKKLDDEGSSSNSKIAAIIGYLGILGFLIAYLALHKKGDEFSAFHLRQGLGIAILLLLPTFSFVFAIPLIVSSAISIAIFVMWLLGIIGAAQGEKKPVFLLGNFFQKIFGGIN